MTLFATLRKLGHLCFGYIDDSYLDGDTITECVHTIDTTVALFQKVAFIIHQQKSVLERVQPALQTYIEFYYRFGSESLL